MSKALSRARKVTISGPPGSGKSTVAALLAKRLRVDLISAGEMFRAMAHKAGVSLAELSHLAEQDWQIDKELDSRMLELLRQKEKGVFDGRLVGYLAYTNGIQALKTYLDAQRDVRIRRIMNREKKDYETVEGEITQRERSEQKRYRSIYQVDLSDRSSFDLIIDSSNLTPEEIVQQIVTT